MSTRSKTTITLFALLTLAAAVANGSDSENKNGDRPFQGNRRPGILEAPTDAPSGENALFYQGVAGLRPNEYLDLLSEDTDTE